MVVIDAAVIWPVTLAFPDAVIPTVLTLAAVKAPDICAVPDADILPADRALSTVFPETDTALATVKL